MLRKLPEERQLIFLEVFFPYKAHTLPTIKHADGSDVH